MNSSDVYIPMPRETFEPTKYCVLLGSDDKPHLYITDNPNYSFKDFPWERGAWQESHFSGTKHVWFDEHVFFQWLIRPTEPGDTFQMFGFDWLVLPSWNHWSMSCERWLLCSVDTPSANRLLMFMLDHQITIRLWYLGLHAHYPYMQGNQLERVVNYYAEVAADGS